MSLFEKLMNVIVCVFRKIRYRVPSTSHAQAHVNDVYFIKYTISYSMDKNAKKRKI